MSASRSTTIALGALSALAVLPSMASAAPLFDVKIARENYPFGAVRVYADQRGFDPSVDLSRPSFLLDGRPGPFKSFGSPYIVRMIAKDGKMHTVTLRLPRADGSTYTQEQRFRAVRPLTATGPVQSAAVARKRGILVRLNASEGFYRATSRSSRIPGAGNVRITAKEGGRASIRVKGSYLARIRPGMKIKVQVRHILGGEALQTKNVTVRFR